MFTYTGQDGSQVHGPNSVISMLDHALTFHGYGEKGAVMHCDNCGGNLSHYLSVFESGTYTHRVGGNRKRP